ncbi:MAG TPA: hypothetical protein VH309_13395 [Elusimicrobiota bacterium]|nr:hypothetical protein [Elusimicrobiota bacterium]
MEIRKCHLIGAIAASAALVVGSAGAQQFDKTVNDALSKDGSIVSQVQTQKAISTQNPDMIEAQHGGGHGGGGRPGGGGHPGGGWGNPGHGNPGHGNPGHGNPGHGNPGHGNPGHGHPGTPGHGRPDWHGHQGGWGDHFHGRYGWGWDAWNRPLWLGWVIWNGAGSCREWYVGRRDGCFADCSAELDACLASGADVGLCNATNVSCTESCDYQYDTVWAPYWGECRF